MRRLLPALIVVAGLFLLPDPARARAPYTPPAEPPPSADERRHELGELLVLAVLAGGIGVLALIQGVREFRACLPSRKPVYLDDDYDD
jgi:hypothetical protein